MISSSMIFRWFYSDDPDVRGGRSVKVMAGFVPIRDAIAPLLEMFVWFEFGHTRWDRSFRLDPGRLPICRQVTIGTRLSP